MTATRTLPACPKCRVTLGPAMFNLGRFARCPGCGSELWVEAFAALVRPIAKGSAGEVVLVPGESTCFYHENKKAVVVCDACGRFLCGLCDLDFHGQHLCPACLESGKKKKTIVQLEDWRFLHGRQALMLAILPLYLTGLAALFLCLRHWRTPGSLVRPARWQMPVALVLATIQVVGLSILIWAAVHR
jgi:hypothetical protein